jgi:hypothetical protein
LIDQTKMLIGNNITEYEMSDHDNDDHNSVTAKHEYIHLDTVAVHSALLSTGKIIAFAGDNARIGDWEILCKEL